MARRTCPGGSAAPAPGTPTHKSTSLSSTQHDTTSSEAQRTFLISEPRASGETDKILYSFFGCCARAPASANFAEPVGEHLSRAHLKAGAALASAHGRARRGPERAVLRISSRSRAHLLKVRRSLHVQTQRLRQASTPVVAVNRGTSHAREQRRARAPGRGRRASSVP